MRVLKDKMEEINISYKILICGLILLLVGFITMALGNNTYGFHKITLSPIMLLTGYALIAYSVLHHKTKKHV